MKKKNRISCRVLRTELSMAIIYINEMNFGYAKKIIENVLGRVDSYLWELYNIK